jgi:hypothetical protein
MGRIRISALRGSNGQGAVLPRTLGVIGWVSSWWRRFLAIGDVRHWLLLVSKAASDSVASRASSWWRSAPCSGL